MGDPFTEKLLLGSLSELMATDAIIAIQDMGAAGLTSSAPKWATRAAAASSSISIRCRSAKTNMTAYEMMLSESQERMLAVLKPGREKQAQAIFRKWELDFAVIGITTDTKRLVVKQRARSWPTCPSPRFPTKRRSMSALHGNEKSLRRGARLSTRPARRWNRFSTLLGVARLCSRRWVWEQYDYR